ncbi:SLBB domain-containing protein [Puniceicoccus vermicola]|uniref:SLBB domain-containing protein n=1 Tax=Puniceicoccus vermicola TaxID=388746 RepID=A0A7X1E5N6_9BACT|nr:SLBB domain-containing protein [Puniceicoccus vermicola]MBC2603334.1 SLBB domain-containing protein [Puniceicoccus vermicola]
MRFIKPVHLLLPALGLISGCVHHPHNPGPGEYAWAETIYEPSSQVPNVEQAPFQKQASPTDESYLDLNRPAGQPIDLTQTVENINASENARRKALNPKSNPNSSRLENLYEGNFEQAPSDDLTQFGYDYFRAGGSSSASVGPVPSNYRIGTGDEVIISLSGNVEAYHKLTVDRNGNIQIPNFGTLPVSGVAFGELADRIDSFLQERRVGYDLGVSLGQLRQIQINVIGRVAQPGRIEVSSLSTPLDVLVAAGGPTKDGSLRNISLVHPDQTRSDIDLYDFLLGNRESFDFPQLMDGDTLHVPSIGPTVGVAGYVQQPAIYEIPESPVTIEQVVNLAGGLTAFSFTPLAQLERTLDGRGRERIDISLDEEGMQTKMANGELLTVSAVDEIRKAIVRIEGSIVRPGNYAYSQGMRLSDLVENADGLSIDAFLPQVFISRQIGPALPVGTITERTGHLQSNRIIVKDLSKALVGDPFHDIELMPLDLVTVRSQKESNIYASVEIIGSVLNPGKYQLTPDMRVTDLVAIAGNPNSDVYYDEAELIRQVFDPETRRMDVKRFRFNLNEALESTEGDEHKNNPLLANGDKLIIRSLQKAQVRVSISGSVRFPGTYIFPSGSRITDLISAAGGVLPDADLRAAKFTRLSTKRLQQDRLEHLLETSRRANEEALTNLIQTGNSQDAISAKLALRQNLSSINRMRKMQADGRIVIPFAKSNFPETPYNLTLESGDALEIPRYHSTISIAGFVYNPISLVVDDYMTVKEALDQAGGLTDEGDEDLLYVVRADGSVDSVSQPGHHLTMRSRLLPGDVLIAPESVQERTIGGQIQDILIVARQLAEIGLIGSNISRGSDTTLVSPLIYEGPEGVSEEIVE